MSQYNSYNQFNQFNQLASTHPRISERSQKIDARPSRYRQVVGTGQARVGARTINQLDNQTSMINNGRVMRSNANINNNNVSRALDIKFRNRFPNRVVGQVPNAQLAPNIPVTPITPLAPVTPLNTPNGVPVASSMTVLTDSINSLRFNLESPVFDATFNSRPIRSVNMTRNLNGSVNFAILYDNAVGTLTRYPPNPAYDNFITPSEIDSPIYKGMHYWQDGSIIF